MWLNNELNGKLYAFDVHCNSFFPMFVMLYVIHYFLSPLLVAHGFIPVLLSNLLFMVAASYYHYLNFLGYDVLPFLERTTFFLYPIGVVIVLSPIYIDVCLSINGCVDQVEMKIPVVQVPMEREILRCGKQSRFWRATVPDEIKMFAWCHGEQALVAGGIHSCRYIKMMQRMWLHGHHQQNGIFKVNFDAAVSCEEVAEKLLGLTKMLRSA
ncbi:hypothetical protein CRYUN_Cryun10bG0115200 [Craigia yunnanensis]